MIKLKIVFIGVLTLVILISFSYLLYSGNTFKSDVRKIEVQKYDQEGNEMGKVKVIEDKASLQTFTEIMDSSIHDKDRHSLLALAHHNDYKVRIIFENKRQDKLSMWTGGGKSIHFFRKSNGKWYQINDETKRQELLSLFKQIE